MNYGCSERLCIAIECHRPSLLKSLLERPNIVYRDIFWARLPIPRWSFHFCYGNFIEGFPILHEIHADTDLSKVCRQDCRHKLLDVELYHPLTDDITDRILVSLPIMALCHSNYYFDALKLLRESSKFDLAEPQFAHSCLVSTEHSFWSFHTAPLVRHIYFATARTIRYSHFYSIAGCAYGAGVASILMRFSWI